MRALVFATSVLLSAPAAAEVVVHYPVKIPQECFELAQREGVPALVSHRALTWFSASQALRAAVFRCRKPSCLGDFLPQSMSDRRDYLDAKHPEGWQG